MQNDGMFSKVLLVEDEVNLATTLRVALRKLQIQARHVTTIDEARAAIADDAGTELVVLDRRLPDGDGLDLCAELRAKGFRGAILMLTASGQVEDRVEGLNRGADEYLAKPFAWAELEARIRALARRRTGFAPELAMGPVATTATTATAAAGAAAAGPAQDVAQLWTLDEKRLRILGARGWVELTPLEFKLATKLIQAEGEIVTRDSLLKDVWGFTLLPKTRTVDHFLGRLRKAFEQDPEVPRHFLTVRGAGYRFARTSDA